MCKFRVFSYSFLTSSHFQVHGGDNVSAEGGQVMFVFFTSWTTSENLARACRHFLLAHLAGLGLVNWCFYTGGVLSGDITFRFKHDDILLLKHILNSHIYTF